MDQVHALFDQYPIIPLGMAVAMIVIAVLQRNRAKSDSPTDPKQQAKTALDARLMKWSDKDEFRVRDLLNGGLLIMGRAGSGKTSSSGRTLMQAIVGFEDQKQ